MSDALYALDASALLALFLNEDGADKVRECLPFAVMSAVNLSEAVAKLQERGVPDDDVDVSLMEVGLDIHAFDERQALIAGRLRRDTREAGLSFGDRACLALARSLDAIALTTDRAWSELDPGLRIELAR